MKISKTQMEHIGKRLRDRRKSFKMTQVELGEASTVIQSRISKFERGVYSFPDAGALRRMAEALSISMDELLED